MEHKWKYNPKDRIWFCPICSVWLSGPEPIYVALTVKKVMEKIQQRANRSGISEDCAQELVKTIMQS